MIVFGFSRKRTRVALGLALGLAHCWQPLLGMYWNTSNSVSEATGTKKGTKKKWGEREGCIL